MNIKDHDLAVIGMSARFPGANSISEFWENICAKKESIRLLSDEELRNAGVPERDIADSAYVKASASLDDVEMFDPGFFKISPLEAELMDPQIRLLLQCAWETLEDAGHATKDAQNIGVFAGAGGVTTSYFANFVNLDDRFQKITAGATHLGNDKDFLSTYISYKLNLTGPSMTVQTACSTSLVALHQARQSLLSGECEMALAGGVTVRVPHLQGYQYKEGYIFSRSGQIKAFDEGADGVVFGSGLGLVLLKRLSAAIADGDNIYAVIKGSAIMNDGKGKMSYAASSAKGQIACVRSALKNAGVDAESIGFVESHGTGTAMGDPEEVKALSSAFKEQTDKKGYCALGAVKTNIGHLEAAAGIAGFIKTVLAVKYGVIPPTAHYTTPNPRIKFENTPFYVNSTLEQWSEDKKPRRAAINSLGVGGTNAFVIIENYVAPRRTAKQVHGAPFIIPLAAKSKARLRAYAKKFAEFLTELPSDSKKSALELADLAYTLQIGREAMDARVAFVVSTLDELKRDLGLFLDEKEIAVPQDDADSAEALALAASWAAGGDVEWIKLYQDSKPRRISLPSYAFAKERCWIAQGLINPSKAMLHPLLHANTSNLNEQKYSSIFTGEEFFLKDHQLSIKQRGGAAHSQRILPGVAYLEMARAALEQAAPIHHDASVLEIRDTVWLQPIIVATETQVNIAMVATLSDDKSEQYVDFEVYTQNDHIHCQGRCWFISATTQQHVDLAQIKETMQQRQWTGDSVYAAFKKMGLEYGPAYRTITEVARNERELLARLLLPASMQAGGVDYVLHPSLLDGAFQAATVLLLDPQNPADYPIVPFAMESLCAIAPCGGEMFAWARYAQNSQPSDKTAKLDIDLLDADGNLCVRVRGFAPRALGKEALGSLIATQVWQPNEVTQGQAAYAEQHVVLCGLPQVDVDKIARDCSLLPSEEQKNLAERYSDLAFACFFKLQELIKSRPHGKTLVQIALANSEENAVYAGLSGLLKTAALENPQIAGQIVLVDPTISTLELATLLHVERGHPHDTLIKYEQGTRYTAIWHFLDNEDIGLFDAECPFKDHGVYLITGGLGGLGVLFAKEILARAANVTIILTGRASLAEVKKSTRKKALLESLHALQGANNLIEYHQLDLEEPKQVEETLAAICQKYRQLNGIIHSAGMTADGFILNKTEDEFRSVLAAKVASTLQLDIATRDLDLDFLVLFSSLTSAVGNLGQADYAAANGFLDEFAGYRNRLVRAGERRGTTVAIRWPLWQDGGMQPDAAGLDMLHETTGIYPMQTATGMRMFYRGLALGLDQILVMEGNLRVMHRALGVGTPLHASAAVLDKPQTEESTEAQGNLTELAEAFLCKQFSSLLKLSNVVDPRSSLDEYGIDSILALDLTRLLEKNFGALPKTLFFEYLSIRELAAYFVKAHAPTLVTLFAANTGTTEAQSTAIIGVSKSATIASIRTQRRLFDDEGRKKVQELIATDLIAIVGLSGRYPQSPDLKVFWQQLRDGNDCIIEVPSERWDWREYYSTDRTQKGCHYSKWGGFIEGVDEFDARFFNISPAEAVTIDPQERLFLQHTWMAMEDAGYTRASLQIPKENDLPAQVGVYAGAMYGEYQLFGAEASLQGNRLGIASNLASIANRVSYALNLHGPSMVVDTMCSSSLTAIHLASQDLKLGRTALGIAGGVNITIHPNKYLMLSAGQFISSDGHCQSFGEGGDGYIPGEGVGVVVLKRLLDAERDGNQIYAVIRGSALSHGGKTNGYTVPNPQAQASAVRQALVEASVNPRHISYIEAHGTGTKLGDPIEIAALTRAFQQSTQDTGFCLIGSAKSNIGHCEAAAGIAGLTKVLLQMKHKTIVPSLHSARLNPHIDFASTPFIVNQKLTPWEQPVINGKSYPRIAGISSFGAGGANAHLIIEEYQPVAAAKKQEPAYCIVPLSARTPEQLWQKAHDLLAHLGNETQTLSAIAYTLQVGREAMDERLSIVAANISQLAERLQAYLDKHVALDGLYQGQVKTNRDTLALLTQDIDLNAAVVKWIADGKLAKLAELWVKGMEVDWRKLYTATPTPTLISLPTYPFAKQRYWLDAAATASRVPTSLSDALQPQLHPLLHSNTSDFSQQSYVSAFKGDEFFFTGEAGHRCMTSATYLEMARAAIDTALPSDKEASILELHDVAWAQPGMLVNSKPITIALFDKLAEQVKFEIYSAGVGDVADTVHCQGRVGRSDQPAPAQLDLATASGLLVLSLPSDLEQGQDHFVLHPALLQKALQAAASYTDGLTEPVSMTMLRAVFPSSKAKFAWARPSTLWPQAIDIDLIDEQGYVCVQMRGLRYEVAASHNVEVEPKPSSVAPAKLQASALAVVAMDSKPPLGPVRVHFKTSATSAFSAGAPTHIPDTPILSKPKHSIALQQPSATIGISDMPSRVAGRIRIDAPASLKVMPVAAADVASVAIPGAAILNKPSASIMLLATNNLPTLDTAPNVRAKPRRPLSASLLAAASSSSTASAPATSIVSLFDNGNGVFSIRIATDSKQHTLSNAVIADLLSAIQVVALASSAKVLMLEGGADYFLSGGLAQHRAALDAKLYTALAQFPYPVIAIASGDAIGAGFILAAASDFLICSTSARYAFALPAEGLYPAAVEDFLIERFTRPLATDFLYLTATSSGAELQAKGWTCPILPREKVAAYAQQLAANLAKKSQTSLRLLKQHFARHITSKLQALPMAAMVDTALLASEVAKTPSPLTSPSARLRLEPHSASVLVVRICAAAAQASGPELLDDLQLVFAELNDAASYRCLVLASELAQFWPASLDDSVVQALQSALLALNRPIVAALQSDAGAMAWYLAQFCDVCVISEQGHYSCADVLRNAKLASTVPAVFALRCGDEAAKQILLTGGVATGSQIRELCGAMQVVDATQVLARALQLATALAVFPITILSAWKQRNLSLLNATNTPLIGDLIDERSEQTGTAVAKELRFESTVISAIAHPDGVLEVRMADRDAKNMFSEAFTRGMQEVFAHAEASSAYKVVVLTGYDNYFSSGGTQDILLAIQEGKAKFTDNKVFQLPLTCSLPVIAAMQGHGIGAGWAMGMYADITLFSDESRYFSPYMGYNFTPGAGSTLMFPAKIGYDLARETLLTAQEYSGGELKERGLRNQVLSREQVLPTALTLARQIAKSATRTRLIALKRHWADGLQASLEDTFERELAMHEQTFVGKADTLARIQDRFANETAPRPAAVQAEATASTQVAVVPDLASISASLKQMLANELRMQENEIAEDEQFVDLGLDSITGVTWIRHINETYGTKIEAIKVYSYPTLNQLARFVQQEIPQQTASATPIPTSVVSPAPVLALASSAPVADIGAITAMLRSMLANELRMEEREIAEDERFVDLGLDSITGVTWIRRINEQYGTAIEAIKVYSYPTLTELSRYVREEAEKAGTLVVAAVVTTPAAAISLPVISPPSSSPANAPSARVAVSALSSWRMQRQSKTIGSAIGMQPIAVIGMAGQFAKSKNLEEFWQNIAQGRDCIEEIPKSRWDIDLYYQEGEPAPGKTYSRWMGALEEYDLFDAAFFNISPREAKNMDPQQRLFLQACWHTIEHAGYNPKALAGSRCGVFVGCYVGDYHHQSRREQISGQGFTGAAPAILAARISYLLDLHGPSIPIDTACSSSLVAVSTACDSLISGGSDLALAGGVNVMAGPAMQIMTSQVGMLSPQGRCYSFDERANGIANGEGVGVVMLKRLADAERDRDCIYGVLEGWGINQDGKTNGITAPNPDSQARLQQEVYEKFNINPATIQLIEAHGTGTPLGDPIEVAGLKTSFGKFTSNKDYCALGSVKSNIGHCLTAAGISGLLKILLAFKYEQLPPTNHFKKLNKHILLQNSPFYINDKLRAWQRQGAEPRRAAINSFGFSGTNAHVVLAQYHEQQELPVSNTSVIVPLSAQTVNQLLHKTHDLLAFLRSNATTLDLVRVAYTLQVGRETGNERVAFIASTFAELERKLAAFAGNAEAAALPAQVYRGQVSSNKDSLSTLSADPDFKAMIAKWIVRKELPRLADLWVKGMALDWKIFYSAGSLPRRIGLPGYPFAKERHWINVTAEDRHFVATGTNTVLHPLLHSNISDLNCQKYSTTLAGNEFFLLERTDLGQQVLSCAASLEMARVAGAKAIPSLSAADGIELRTLTWARPVGKGEVSIALMLENDGCVAFQIASGAPEVVHCDGQIVLHAASVAQRLDLAQLQARINTRGPSVDAVYENFSRSGIVYTDRLRALTDIRVGTGELLALLVLPAALATSSADYQLHPSMLEGALQAGLMLLADAAGPLAVTRIASLKLLAPCSNEMFAWVRRNADASVEIDLCDRDGKLCVQLSGVARTASAALPALALLPAPLVSATQATSVPKQTAVSVSQEQLQQQLKASLAEALFMQASDVDVRKSFTELGLDSIIGVEWVNVINKQYATELSATRIYDYPSVRELAAYMHGQLALQQPVAVATPLSQVTNSIMPSVLPALPSTKATTTNSTISREVLQQQLKASLAEALFMQVSDVDINKSFTELGLDSIIGVEWVNVINKQYATELSATRIYDYPSVSELAAYMHEQRALQQPAVVAMLSPPVANLIMSSALPAMPSSTATTTISTISREVLQQQLKASLAEALFMQVSDVDINKSFTELGLDSIIGVEWVNVINKQYAAELSATRIYDYPSVSELAAYLHGQLALQQPVVVATPLPAVANLIMSSASPAVPSSTATTTISTISREVLQQQLKASLAEALFMQVSDVDINKSFTELGLDSIIGVEWVNVINKQYATELSATRIYDYPSVKELADYLFGEIPGAAAATPVLLQSAAPASFTPIAPPTVPARIIAPATLATLMPAKIDSFASRATRFSRQAGIRFEPKYGKQFKTLYFYSADAEGDFETDGEFTIAYVINPENNVCLKEHVVFGEHLLPTDAYIELVYSAYLSYFAPNNVCLKNIVIANPILGAKGSDTHIKLMFRRAGAELQFFVKSSNSADFANHKIHMQGAIAIAASPGACRFNERFALEKTLAKNEIATNAGMYYAPLQSLNFGQSSAMGVIHIADHTFNFLSNPFAQYGGLCTIINYASYLASRHFGASDDQFLPYRIGQINLLAPLDQREYRSYAEVKKLERDAIEFYFEIVDSTGRAVLTFDSIVLHRVARKAIQQQVSNAQRLPALATPRSRSSGTANEVAIIGMSCRFAMSENVDKLWANLTAGKDCVIEIPLERWGDYSNWYHPDPRRPHTSYSKWCGMLDNIDSFDALFFGIAPAEAELIDPQQRIFMEECWKTIESAGYAPSRLANQACGVYVGCSMSDYGRVLNRAGQDTAGAAFMGTSSAILAARISYYLNLKGPAIAFDTACSASLVALHMACESIRCGDNQMALAGGVNVLATAFGHILTSQVGMLSRDGRCATFDASANGIVYSEGCGVLLLKALADAERDNDNILGVIQGSGCNQDGKTNGITAPSSKAQEQLLRNVYGKFAIDPKRISYVEAHGTATPLGDPIEVNALTSVFGKPLDGNKYCALGSVKTNIGHCGFAAGVAGVIKVLLCLKHKKLVPSIHYSKPNPHIEFDKSPFYVNTQYRDWDSKLPRMATVSSFGFSGTNAHVVIAEYVSRQVPVTTSGKVLVPLSAKASKQLQQQALDLLDFLNKQEQPLDLASLAYTLQIGRDAMDHRLAFIVDSQQQLMEKLQGYLAGKAHIQDVYRGQASLGDETLTAFANDADIRDVINRWIEQKNLPKVADLWVKGFELDWAKHNEGSRLQRMMLPSYPFAKEHCWVETTGKTFAALHPLLHSNTSNLGQQCYTSHFTGNEFFLADHRVNAQPVLPAMAYLEMARAALEDALPAEQAGLHLELRHVAWAQPIVVSEAKSVTLAVFMDDAAQLGFEVFSQAAGDDVMHCQGSCVLLQAPAPQTLDLGALRAQMTRGSLAASELYPAFAKLGLNYGPTFQGVQALHQGEDQALVELALPAGARNRNFVLNPSMLDSALQGSISLIGGLTGGKTALPFAVESVHMLAPCGDQMLAWVRYSPGAAGVANLIKVDIDLCQPDGKVCVQMRGFSSRPMETFDEEHYQSIIAGILSKQISVDEAVELGTL